ncbi:MAG TPA: HAMP domain-containing sensor histidine kinase [Paucimonas sp.]|nr:HAMP domain-containing sensor histidine kinase [Paucimonas sp.]
MSRNGPRLSQRLYIRIYAALLASIALAAILFGIAWRVTLQSTHPGPHLETFAEIVGETLPPATASHEEQQEALRRWRPHLRAHLALYAADGTKIAALGRELPPPDLSQKSSGWLGGHPPVFALKLPDGRWLIGKRSRPGRDAPFGLFAIVGLIAVAIGIGAYPVVRRITGRLERLQTSVEALGAGQLSTRVAVEGKDEVARVAESFNRSAERIEALVAAQKSLLANASHELRSPLARIRMAVQLMETQAAAPMQEELKRNIAELDQLIDEILLASRLDAAGAEALHCEEIDFPALVAEECARADARFTAETATLQGDARLLRRMVRNLLENAGRYGDGTAIEVFLRALPGAVELDVCDRGNGVPEAERERIFGPFYRLPGARERDGGVGLGLSLVRQIARRHGGDVSCIARDGGGSCFRVRLPA